MKLILSLFLLSACSSTVDAAPASSVCRVTSGGDSGPGSLRDALASCESEIKISDTVKTINIDSTLNYNESSELEIKGSGQTIQASGDFTLLSINDGADLYIKQLTFAGAGGFGPKADGNKQGDGKGIFVKVPPDATGTVKIELRDVTVQNVAYHGIHVSDCDAGDDCGNGGTGDGDGSDASVEIKFNGVTVQDVGLGRVDGDGLRVDERGPGDIKFEMKDGLFTGVGADGIELDEAGPGDVIADIKDSTITNNGAYCDVDNFDKFEGCDDDGEADVDDGLDIDEEDEGSVYLTVKNVIISDNSDEGFDIDEAGPGDIIAEFTEVTANGNKDEGIKCSEEDGGDLSVKVKSSTVNDAKDNDGMQFESEDNGQVDVEIKDTEATGNAGEDLKVEQPDDGVDLGSLKIRDSVIGIVETDNIKFV